MIVPQNSAYASYWSGVIAQKNRTVLPTTDPTFPWQHPSLIRTSRESPHRDVISGDIGMPNSKISVIGGLMRYFVIPCNKNEKIETEFFRLNYHICY